MDLTSIGDNDLDTILKDIDMSLDYGAVSSITQNATTINNYFGSVPKRNSPTPPPPEADEWEMCVNSTYSLGYCKEYCPDCEARGAIYEERSEGFLIDTIHTILSHLLLVSPAPKYLVHDDEVYDDTEKQEDIIDVEVEDDSKSLPAPKEAKGNELISWQQRQLEHEKEMLELEKKSIELERDKLAYQTYQSKLEEEEIERVSSDINKRFQEELKKRGA